MIRCDSERNGAASGQPSRESGVGEARTAKVKAGKGIKNYVLDTNVLLHDPDALLNFQENHVWIPIEVIEEVDKFKKETTERGQNARAVARKLDQLRKTGSLSTGVPLSNGGKLSIIFSESKGSRSGKGTTSQSPDWRGETTVDNRILELALKIKGEHPKRPTILVTKDINLRLKSDIHGLAAEDYETDQVNLKDLYTGCFDLEVEEAVFRDFKHRRQVPLPPGKARYPNQYCTIFAGSDPKRTMLARVDGEGKNLIGLQDSQNVWGIKPKNREQHFALDALLDENIKLVTLMGKAGTGKTLIALAAGLKKAVTDREYRRLVIARPTISMGKELGFLPGTLDEKLAPWMQPIHDALELLSDLNMGRGEARSQDLLRGGMIVVEALSYIRGRSIAHQFMIVDEAQNLTPLEAKTILTRVGQGTKVVLTGDPYQIDNPYVDVASNGFNYVVSHFRNQSLAAHIELQQGERSELAELAANIL